MNQTVFLIVEGITLIFVIISTFLLVLNNKKLKAYKQMYDKALAKFDNADIPNAEFNIIYERLNRVEDNDAKIEKEIDDMKLENLKDIKKIGFVKYNAYEEGDSKLSFALAMTDANMSGIMLNKIYSKHGSNLYAKEIKEGKIEERISKEEEIALTQIRTGQDIHPEVLLKGIKNGKTKKN